MPEKMFARIHFRHPDFADDDVFVSTGLPLSDWLRAFNVKPVDAKFTHTLEPARPVTGVVTDKETGKPLAGVLVEMIPMRMKSSRRKFPVLVQDGRIRPLPRRRGGRRLLLGCRLPRSRVGLSPGRENAERVARGGESPGDQPRLAQAQGSILRGRVVEAGSGRPVAGASVVYEPGPGNPHNRDEYEFRNPVLTDR